MLAQLCERMVKAGVPLWRVAVFVTTLHPDVMGRSFRWQAKSGVTVSEALHSFKETDDYRKSPVVAVYDTRSMIRRPLADPECPDDFAILRDLRAQGATDYAAFPLIFTDGTIHVATWSTRQPGGFTAKQFADLVSIVAPLARVAEIRALRRTSENLIDTYVGHQTGERILSGKIRRGYVEAIRAAIWLSDMRGFTSVSERLPPQALIDRLNLYFGCQVPAVLGHGGEVLRFMGDGLLAIFPSPRRVKSARFVSGRSRARRNSSKASPSCRRPATTRHRSALALRFMSARSCTATSAAAIASISPASARQ